MSRTQIDASLVPSSYQRNIALNGGFDLWTNGTTWPVNQDLTTPTDTADYWQSSYNGTALFSYTQNSTTQESGRYALDINTTFVGTTTRQRIVQFSQPSGTGITNPAIYSGRTLTLTARVKCPAFGKVSLMLEDSSGSTESAYNQSISVYETLTVTRTITANTTSLNIYVGYNSQSPVVGILTIDSVMLTMGPLSQTFVPSDPAEDKIRTFNTYTTPVNIMDNGGFEIWQRGTSFTGAAQTYTADRWLYSSNGVPTLAITKETTVTDGSPSALKWNLTSVGSGTVFRMLYRFESAQYAGKTLSLKARIRVDSGGGGFVQITMTDGVGGSIAQNTLKSGAGVYETVTCSLAFGATSTTGQLQLDFNNVPGVAYLDNFMLVLGNQAVDYVPMNPQVELARCQRYFYATPAITNVFICHGQCQNTTTASYILRFPVPMRVGPTLTVNNTANFSTWNAGGSNIALTALTNAGAAANSDTYFLQSSVASGLVAGNVTSLLTTNANAQLFFSADL
jgi:hypothetical protein